MKKVIVLLCLACCIVSGSDLKKGINAYEKGDYGNAFKYYKLACDGEHAVGCGLLGTLYKFGKGVRQNYSVAKEYFGKACDLGSQLGCDDYSKLNKRGY